MKFFKNITRACLIISFAFIYSCSNSSSSSNASAAKIYNVDGAPTATETPASGSVISTTENIKIVFNESMDTSTLTLGGTLEPEATFA